MDAEELSRLAESIAAHGVLQPLLVRRRGDRYELVAGERRLRAAASLEMEDVPVIVRDVSDEGMMELALVENLQREDLDPIEKAESFRAYLERSGRTQAEAAQRLGLDRSTIANMIRLLDLPDDVRRLVRGGRVAMGHARAILAIGDPARQIAVAQRVAREGLSVRQVERIASGGRPSRRRSAPKPKPPYVRDVEARLREGLGTKVSVEEGRKAGTGRIVIDFYTPDDLDRILGLLA
jgi:ParB family chromosome partitioning protein